MTDMFLLLLQPGGGDELQGIKRGIMELADLVLFNKADGDLKKLAGRTAAEYRNALRLLHPRSAHWQVEVLTCSAIARTGIAEAWDIVLRHQQALTDSGELAARRAQQARGWMWAEVQDSLIADLREDPEVRRHLPELEAATSEGRLPAAAAASRLLKIYLKRQ